MSSSEDQNGVDQRFAIFYNPTRDLVQNWEIDISQILDEYLEKIDSMDANFQNRYFSEAAMVVQGSASIYSRKVEYYEKVILQVLSEFGSSQSINSIEKESANTKRKERVQRIKSLSLNDLEFENVDDIQTGKNINLVNDDDHNHKKTSFKFLPVVSIQLHEKYENKSSHEVELFEKEEFISGKADFYLNRCCLLPDGCLSINPPTKSSQNILPQDLVFQEGNNSFNDLLRKAYDLDMGNEEEQCADNEQNIQGPIAENTNTDIGNLQNTDECQLEPESAKDLNNNVSQDDDITVAIKLPNGRRSSLRKRSSKCAKPQIQSMHMLEPYNCSPSSRSVMRGRIRRLIPCRCHTTHKRKRYNPTIYVRDKVLGKSKLMPIDDFIAKSILRWKNKTRLKVPPEIIVEANNERLKRKNILENRYAMLNEAEEVADHDISELRQSIEEVLNENIEDDYYQLLWDDDLQQPHADISSIDAENNVLESAVPPAKTQLQENDLDEVFEPITAEEWDLIGESMYPPNSIYEANLQRRMAHYMLGAQKNLDYNEIVQRVNRWKSSIMPKLEAEEKRKNFDIHSYGVEVIQKFSQIGDTLTFEEVARKFPQKDVSRVFLSCLMLGNTYNLKLFNTERSPSMDDLKLALLSRVRQHEQMEEYAAPSQLQVAPKRKRPESIIVQHGYNNNNKKRKKKVTFDSGIFSTFVSSSFNFSNI